MTLIDIIYIAAIFGAYALAKAEMRMAGRAGK